MRRSQQGRDSGFTLVELLAVMLLFGIIVAIGVGPWKNYQRRQDHLGTTREVVALLRNAQVSSVSENRTYRVDFAADGRSADVFALDGAAYVRVRTYRTSHPSVTLSGAAFADAAGTGRSAYFYPRGAASRGSVRVLLSGKSEVYTIQVEGLTARVSYND